MDNSNIIGISYSQLNNVKVSMKRAQQMLETSQRNLSTARVQLQVDRGRLRITEDSLSNLYSEASKRKTKIDKICNNIDYTVRRFKEVDSRCAANIRAIGKYYNSQISLLDRIKNSILGIGKYLFNGFTSLLEEGANAFDFLKTKASEAYNAVSEFMEAHPWIGNTIGVIGGIGQIGVYALLLTPPFTPIGVAGMAFGFNSAVYSGTKLINNVTNGSNEGINVLENVFSLFGDGGKTAYNILDMGFAIATVPIEGGFALSKASQIVKESNGAIKGFGALSKGIKEVEKMKVDKLSSIFSSTLGKIIEPMSKTSEYFKNCFGNSFNFRGFMPQLAGQGNINIAISMSDVIDYAKVKEIAGVVGIISKESGLIYNAIDKAGDILKGAGGGSNATEGAVDAVEDVKYGEHFTKVDRKKVLKPNVSYETVEGYKYKTNEVGVITEVEGTLKLGEGNRNLYAQRIAGGDYRLPDDDGGHLIASQFLGSGELDNLVPMNSQINRSGGKWYNMEQDWASALKEGKEVRVKIEPVYGVDNLRPISFEIEYTIEGMKTKFIEILNQAGG
ncbi:DNA/RNA non-specific endonuclease [Clostridium intestinale]|uniref:DNA/RNA non-specific endonuclease n=2 Tax=Clostridium intestinale TaxID=36845 RepID=A0A7D6VSV4_9CLOT|nr:DNA/RNA non-specific endonuclease [Clostridium intestinale]